MRLYSIASSRYGDDMTGKTGSLCVRRAVYVDPETGKEDDSKKGVCSNFLCDAKPGQELTMTGPSGKVMLMPEQDPKTDLIMVATGTGIAPYRGFIRRLFVEKVRRAHRRRGRAPRARAALDAQSGASRERPERVQREGVCPCARAQRNSSTRAPSRAAPSPSGGARRAVAQRRRRAPPLRPWARADAGRRGVQGPGVALPRRGQLGLAALRRRVAGALAPAGLVLPPDWCSRRTGAAAGLVLPPDWCSHRITWRLHTLRARASVSPRTTARRRHAAHQASLKTHPSNFRLDYALSREQNNKAGGKMYIQDKVEEYADEIFAKLEKGAHMYFCGLKGMMPGITEMLERVAQSKGISWEEKLEELKKNGQWHVEVY